MNVQINNISPFNIICESIYEETKHFTYHVLIVYGRVYYYLKDTSLDYISIIINTRYEKGDKDAFKSRFVHFGETEKICIEKLEVISSFENKGVMTIMFRDIM